MRTSDLFRWLSRVAAACVLGAILGGCASDPRAGKGLQWVEDQAAERQRLDAMGFPQFTGQN
jgi:hypothetical protein